MKDDRFIAHIAQFPRRHQKALSLKLDYKKRLESDSSFKLPCRIWLAFLTPRTPEILKGMPPSFRDVKKLKEMMVQNLDKPEQFLEMRGQGRPTSECITLAILETLYDLEESKILLTRKQYDVWIEIAEHFGLWKMRYALEDLVFKTFEGEQYAIFRSAVQKQMIIDKHIIADVRTVVTHALEKVGIRKFKIVNRQKNIYGVYQKIQKKGLSINKIFDIHGFRILVATKKDCYRAFDAINALWPHFRERFKDYIAHPKANGYQSIHTVFSSIEQRPIEFQIRTFEMDSIAESGRANHAAYKKQSGR